MHRQYGIPKYYCIGSDRERRKERKKGGWELGEGCLVKVKTMKEGGKEGVKREKIMVVVQRQYIVGDFKKAYKYEDTLIGKGIR